MASVRVLPALIAVSIGALAFKGVDLAQAAAENTDPANSAPAEDLPDTSGGIGSASLTSDLDAPDDDSGVAAAEALAPASEVCLPSIDYAAETGISEQEILVLRSLADRRAVLDEREAGVETREQAAAAAEARLAEQIEDLKAVETEVQRLLAAMDAKRDERMDALVRTYEAMKPKDAARIFNGMNDAVLLDLAKSMKPATLAAIMASMDSKRAEALTIMLANLAQPPATLESLQTSSG